MPYRQKKTFKILKTFKERFFFLKFQHLFELKIAWNSCGFITYFSVDPILCASAAAKAAELALQNDSSCSLSVSYSNHVFYES